MESTAGTRKRNPRGEGERLRAALIEAAGELLLEHGSADRLSIRGVTARAGVSPTALYLHFADKDELVRAVCDEAFEELAAFLERAAAAHDGDPRAQLRAMGEAYMEFAQQRPGLFRILFGTVGRFGPGGPEKDDPGMRALAALVQGIERCLPDERDPRAVAVQLWTAIHGFISLRSVMPGFGWPSSDEYLQTLFDAQLGGRGRS